MPMPTAHCPYCGERLDMVVDDSAGDQRYIEDCAVCCRPIQVHAVVDEDGDVVVTLRRDDDA